MFGLLPWAAAILIHSSYFQPQMPMSCEDPSPNACSLLACIFLPSANNKSLSHSKDPFYQGKVSLNQAEPIFLLSALSPSIFPSCDFYLSPGTHLNNQSPCSLLAIYVWYAGLIWVCSEKHSILILKCRAAVCHIYQLCQVQKCFLPVRAD